MDESVKVEDGSEVTLSPQATQIVVMALIGYATVAYCTGWIVMKGLGKAFEIVDQKLTHRRFMKDQAEKA